MATRLYIENTAVPPPITPAYSAGWDRTASASRAATSRFKAGTAFLKIGSGGEVSAALTNGLIRQMVTAPLNGDQTISGTLKGIILAASSSLSADYRSQMRAYVVSGDGSTVRGVLLEIDNSTGLTSEWNTTYTSRKFPVAYAGAGATLTPVNALDGDCVVIEFGSRVHNTSTTAFSDGVEVGSNGADRVEDETTTTQSLSPWFEFSQDLVFKPYARLGSLSAQMLVTASGPARLGAESTQMLVTTKGPAKLAVESSQMLVTTKGPARLAVESVQMLINVAPPFREPHFGSKFMFAALAAAVSNAFYVSNHNTFVAWPAGTAVGDLMVLETEYGWTGLSPVGWATHYDLSAGNGSGALRSKIMTSADISAGGVTLTATGNFDFPGAGSLVRIPGTGGGEQLANTGQSGLIIIGASPSGVEQVISNCDLDLTNPTNVAVIDYDVWWSMSEGGGGKSTTWRIRRDSLTGPVVASGGGGGVTLDTTNGHNAHFAGQFVDAAPTTGRYVLTIQCTGGFNSPIYSDSRIFTVKGGVPAVRAFTGGYSGGGYTSLPLTAPAAVSRFEQILWMTAQRADVVMTLDRANPLGTAHGANASSGVWYEDVAGAGAAGPTGTFGSPGAGANNMTVAVAVSLP